MYLVVFQHVPVERAAQLIADLTGAAPSTGWVSTQVARTSDALTEVEKLIKTLITLAAVIGVDETTVNIAGARSGCTSRAPICSPPTTCTKAAAAPR